jgi:hypothetical protein
MGTGCAWFDGDGSVYQQLSIPSGPGQATLTFRLKIHEGAFPHKLRVKVENMATGHSDIVGIIHGSANTNAGTSHKGYRKFTYNLSSFMGQTVRIRFEAADTSASPMKFYIDNVGLTYRVFGVTE